MSEWENKLKDHEEMDKRNFDDLNKRFDTLEEILKPISETYRTVTRVGKWGMAVLILISVIIGIVSGLKNIFK